MSTPTRFASCHPLSGKRISIVPFPALGDATIYLRLAQSLANAGANVSFHSDLLANSSGLFDWLAITPMSGHKINELAEKSDLLIVDVLAHSFVAFAEATQAPFPTNLLAVTAKRFPEQYQSLPIPPILQNIAKSSPHGPFCPGCKQGPSMIDWVDDYVQRVFGISASPPPPTVNLPPHYEIDRIKNKRVLIFPTTPNPSKNYSLRGFTKIANSITAKGWSTEFVCMPHEQEAISRAVGHHQVCSFHSIRDLVLHMATSSVVVSNDSGGGHLGAMLGLKTITITKKPRDFVWRPGFSESRYVINPTISLKWFTGRIWRPFIPANEIVNIIGTPPT